MSDGEPLDKTPKPLKRVSLRRLSKHSFTERVADFINHSPLRAFTSPHRYPLPAPLSDRPTPPHLNQTLGAIPKNPTTLPDPNQPLSSTPIKQEPTTPLIQVQPPRDTSPTLLISSVRPDSATHVYHFNPDLDRDDLHDLDSDGKI